VLPQAAAHVTVGAVLVPVVLAVKPQLVLPPAATEPLYGRLRAVTASPTVVTEAFQVLVNRWPLGQVQVTVQELIAALPAVTVTVPWKPPLHELFTAKAAVQARPAGGLEGGVDGELGGVEGELGGVLP
jgi:hypothetical protein